MSTEDRERRVRHEWTEQRAFHDVIDPATFQLLDSDDGWSKFHVRSLRKDVHPHSHRSDDLIESLLERAEKAEAERDMLRASLAENVDPAARAMVDAALRAEANRLMAGQWERDTAGRFAGRR